MKKSVMSLVPLLIVVLCTFDVIAQQGRGLERHLNMNPEEIAESQTSHMKDSLDLTSDQVREVEVINLKYAEKMQLIREDSRGNHGAMRSALMEIKKERDKELRDILSAEQWKKFRQFGKEQRKGRWP